MKNRILPLSLVTLVICLGAFFISATVAFPDYFAPDNGNETYSSEQYLAKLRNNQVTGKINPADVIQARMQADKIAAQNGNRDDISWSFLGPDNVGGRTRALIFDNQNENSTTVIAGAVSGGLYKSTNSGQTWFKINGEEENLNVSCMAQAPDGTIYVGTGEGFTIEEYSLFQDLGYNGAFVGTGIYQSTDGENFTQLANTVPVANNDTVAWAFINQLAVNPVDATVWAATNKGIIYSSDAGLTWNIARVGDQAFLLGNSYDVKIGSDGITAVSVEGLAYISDAGHPNQFVLHSSDTFNLPYEDVGRTEFAIAPSDANIIYATVVDTDGDLINVYKSDDRGVHWRIVAPGGSANLNFFQGQGIFDNVLVVFPDDPNRILLGGVAMWEGKQYSETGFYQWTRRSVGFFVPNNHHTYTFRPGTSNEIFVGHDAGISVATITSQGYEFVSRDKTYNTSQFATVGYGGELKRVLGGTYSSGNQYINGSGNPATALDGTAITNGSAGASFISIIDPLVFIYAQTPGGGGFYRSEDEGVNINNTFLAGSISIPDDAYITPCLFWENFENEESRDSVYFGATKDLAAGEMVYVMSDNRGYPFEYTLPAAMNAGDTIMVKDIVSTKFFIGTENAVWMTLDVIKFGGEPEWFKIADQDNSGFEGHAQAMGLSADANYVYVGTQEGELYRLANIKFAYDFERADVSSPFSVISTAKITLPTTQVITSVTVDPQDADNVIVTCGNYGNNSYVFRSTNATSANPTFASIQGNLPKMPVYSSVIEMNDQNLAIIGTDMGMYMAENVGAASPDWVPMSSEVGRVPVFALSQQLVGKEAVTIKLWNGVDTVVEQYAGTSNFGVIYAATYGRGLHMTQYFEKPVGIFNPDIEIQTSKLKVFPNPVSSTATVEYSLDTQTEVIISVFDINGRMVMSEKLVQPAGTHQYKLDCAALPRGTYVTSLHKGNAIETGKFIVVH